MQEAELIKLLQNSKTRNEGFRAMVPMYKERIYWHIRKLVGTHEDADDVVQNTFVKIFKNIESFKGDSKLYTWMYRIATNESLTHLAKRNRIQDGQAILEEKQQHESIIESANLPVDKIIQYLLLAIGQLPPKQRAVFNMKYFDEMSYREMSNVLQTSEGALKASYHHATNKLKSLLQESIHTNA